MAIAAWLVGTPDVDSTVGSHWFMKKKLMTATQFEIQNSGVRTASRPSSNAGIENRERLSSPLMTNCVSGSIARSGRKRFKRATSSPRRCGRKAKNLINSGSASARIVAMTRGAAPPIQNSTRQPYSPTSLAATKPGSPPPNVTPMKIRTTSVARRALRSEFVVQRHEDRQRAAERDAGEHPRGDHLAQIGGESGRQVNMPNA